MKSYSKICLILLVILSANYSFAQYDFTPAKVYLKSGKVLEGEVNLKMQYLHGFSVKEERVKFKNSKAKDEITPKSIDSIVFTVTVEKKENKKKIKYTEQQKFVPLFINKNKKHIQFLHLVRNTNKIKLYGRSTRSGASYGGNGNFAGMSGSNQYFVLKPENEIPLAILPSGPKKFRKEASRYFDDCSKLVEKINSKIYERDAIIEIIDFYISNCPR